MSKEVKDSNSSVKKKKEIKSVTKTDEFKSIDKEEGNSPDESNEVELKDVFKQDFNDLEVDGLEEAIIESVKEEVEEVYQEVVSEEELEKKAFKKNLDTDLDDDDNEDIIEESVKEDVSKGILKNAEKVLKEQPSNKLGNNGCLGFFTPLYDINLKDCINCLYESNCFSHNKAKESENMSINIDDGKELKVAPEDCFSEDTLENEGTEKDMNEDTNEELDSDINELLTSKLDKLEELIMEHKKEIKLGLYATGAIVTLIAIAKLFRKK